MNREENLKSMSSDTFDVCVIGGGASGAGVALDAVLRGYKVALIDRGDFAGETSSKSTKLIHGGVRYLEQAFKNFDFVQLRQVRHGLHERKYLHFNAPYITKKLGLITPVFSYLEGLYYYLGLKIYGFFALKDEFPKARWLTRKEMLAESPDITKRAKAAVLYYDGQLDDARYVLALIKTAQKEGAKLANYCQLDSFKKNKDGKISSAMVSDVLQENRFEIKAKYFINCTGPFSDNIRLMANPEEEKRIVPAKGVHIVLPRKYYRGDKAMLVPKTSDGRLIFIIPFRNRVMIGTTDTPYKNGGEEPQLEKDEAEYLLNTAIPYLDKKPDFSEIISGFGGVRPLLLSKRRDQEKTKSLLRDHEVELDEKSGLISLMGGKWTTYRLMAQDTVDAIDRLEGKLKPCITSDFKLAGNETEAERPPKIEDNLWERLLSYYGTQFKEVLAIAGKNKIKLHPAQPYLEAEVRYACRHEMAQTIRDFMARRIRWETLDWETCKEATDRVAAIMQEELGWSEEKTKNETEKYKNFLTSLESLSKG